MDFGLHPDEPSRKLGHMDVPHFRRKKGDFSTTSCFVFHAALKSTDPIQQLLIRHRITKGNKCFHLLAPFLSENNSLLKCYSTAAC